MPPAFNLSQDQTLQFNHVVFLVLSNRTQEFTKTSNYLDFLYLLECLFALATKHPRLSAVYLLNIIALFEAFAASAAQKRNYNILFSALSTFEKFIFFSFQFHAVFHSCFSAAAVCGGSRTMREFQ
jgi:hypothetical protein